MWSVRLRQRRGKDSSSQVHRHFALQSPRVGEGGIRHAVSALDTSLLQRSSTDEASAAQEGALPRIPHQECPRTRFLGR